jgi:glycine hydroxymethyltransferase
LGYQLVSGGTDTHLILVDLSDRDLSGKAAENALEAAGLTVNKNMVPFDQRSPLVTSGIRIGTPAVTTRGMGAAEMRLIAELIHRVLRDPEDEATRQTVRGEVTEMCKQFPLYQA